jgi:hypothetical protein
MSMAEEDPAPEGYEYVWIPDEYWSTAVSILFGRKCRCGKCEELAVAALKRKRVNHKSGDISHRWWCYCDHHLYGRKIVDGVVMVRILKKLEAA